MKKLLKIVLVIIVVAAAVHLLNGGTLSLEDIKNHAKDLLQANNENVIAVKYGSPQAYPNITYCMAFESFFSSPTWTCFEGVRDGSDIINDIVEFTGNCLYNNEEVKARIQFELHPEDNTFYATYLSVNGISQPQIMLNQLIDKAFSDYQATHSEVN